MAALCPRTANRDAGDRIMGSSAMQQNAAEQLPGFRQGLVDTGFVEGRNVTIEYRFAEGNYERLPEFAADLVRRGVDLIFAGGGDLPAKAAEAATMTLPIVFTTGVDALADDVDTSYEIASC
jgi:putative tryptophan/tyrosine transport system substrate-binding protein